MTRQALHVAVLDDYQGAALRFGRWDRIPADVHVHPIGEHIADADELAARLAGCDVVVAMRERTAIDRALISALPDLRLLVTTGPSNDAIDVDGAKESGVTVCGTGGYVSPTVELTWALVLAVARHVPAEHAAVRDGGWQHTIGVELEGRCFGVVGLGRIGTAVARVATAFGMEVVAWSQNLDADHARSVGVAPVSRDEIFRRADVLSVHLRLSDRTTGLIGAPELGAMKPGAIVVNTSRGPIIDESALVAALRDRTIGGAGLDVFDVEPLPVDHPFRSLPNVVVTPHIGYVTDGLYQRFYDEIVDDIAAWVDGSPRRVIAVP